MKSIKKYFAINCTGSTDPGDENNPQKPDDPAPTVQDNGLLEIYPNALGLVEGDDLPGGTLLAQIQYTGETALTMDSSDVVVTFPAINGQPARPMGVFVTGGNGYWEVYTDLTTTIPEEGDINLSLNVFNNTPISVPLHVADAPIHAANGGIVKVFNNQPWTGTIAKFTDDNPVPDLADISATIRFIDPTGALVFGSTRTIAGTDFVSDGKGGYDIIVTQNFTGNNVFYTGLVTINDLGGRAIACSSQQQPQ